MRIVQKIFLVLIICMFTGCSNLYVSENMKLEEKQKLNTLISAIQKELKNGKTTKLETSLDSKIKKFFIKNELQKIDLSHVVILITKPVFCGNTAKNIVSFTIREKTLYYDIMFKLKNGEWKIVNYNERKE